MTVGDPSQFAIESSITKADANPLGFFLIHLSGLSYGIKDAEATLLDNSLDAVERRLSERGSHTASFALEPNAGFIANEIRLAIYGECVAGRRFWGMTAEKLYGLVGIEGNDLLWAPDGDEAFDDGSFVLQFDVDDCVRLIGFTCMEGLEFTKGTLSDVWLSAEDYYGTLAEWRNRFRHEWECLPKVTFDDQKE